MPALFDILLEVGNLIYESERMQVQVNLACISRPLRGRRNFDTTVRSQVVKRRASSAFTVATVHAFESLGSTKSQRGSIVCKRYPTNRRRVDFLRMLLPRHRRTTWRILPLVLSITTVSSSSMVDSEGESKYPIYI